ncbi:xanthine dehydrogenase family protein molybdopterin-binding subunit [Candidatus Poriferisocius sp.]|uniref:xanthine dehydrogenase family protein molybdopterin-binding subunit n=1 Tax=Candidatus Poriferisocius sp. TaxID=3101276 RepID=UPI003B026653
MAGSILGTEVVRREDGTLLTGEGRFTGDLRPERLLQAHFVRSPVAHALIEGIDLGAATEHRGVAAVYTAETIGVEQVKPRFPLDPHFVRGPLASDRVRFVGEPVAMVVAESLAAAQDAADEIMVDYEPLPVSMDAEAAVANGAAVLYPERGSDAMFRAFDPVDGLHERADRIITARIVHNRMAVVPMETDAALADPTGEQLTLWVSTQGAHPTRGGIADSLGLDHDQVRVIAPWVGGGFGAKGGWRVEHVAVAAAARQLGRPVVWTETRAENLISMQARDQVHYVRQGVTDDGRMVSLEVVVLVDAGAYPALGGVLPTITRVMATGVYAIKQVQFDFGLAATNRAPLGAFRGAGRPQATLTIERMADLAAAELGIDPVEFRRRNFLAPEDFPLVTPTGGAYDTGEYEKALDRACELVGYDDLRAEQAARRAAGDPRRLGVGLSSYVEVTAPTGQEEHAVVEVHPDGSATVSVGTSSHGQGHETAFTMIVADRLGIDLDRIAFVQADTALVARGSGTGGSRSAQLGGSAIHAASMEVLDIARRRAAELLEASADDIVVTDEGRLGVAGVPGAAVSWEQVVAAADEPLRVELDHTTDGATFPFGTHICVVEVDTDTGLVTLRRFVAVDDAGNLLNPLIVAGQQHGGVASGIGQALYEHVVYDDDGNPLTTGLADYAMPSAAEFCDFTVDSTITPTHLNPLGVKGIGEAATIGSTPAVQNAVIDALCDLGIRHIDLPLTPERVWQAIQSAGEPAPDITWPSL